MNLTTLEVIVGTYEQFVVGYKLSGVQDAPSLELSFTNHAHTSSVRCLASSSKFLASGSVDEAIRIFNMKKRSDVGTLLEHTGTITSMQFFENSHLFTASEDASICVWNTKNWQCEKILKGHKDAVHSISVHPSGKLLLSVSKDKTLRTWNLIKGRCAFVTNLKSVAHLVVWSKTGTHFAVAIDKRVDIYEISVAGVVYSINFGKRVNCAAFVDNNTLVLGGDSEQIQIYDISKKCQLQTFDAHENRVKALDCVDSPLQDGKVLLVSTSSDGQIKIWQFENDDMINNPLKLASIDTSCRPTCLAVRVVEDSIQNLDQSSLIENTQSKSNERLKRKKKKSIDKVKKVLRK